MYVWYWVIIGLVGILWFRNTRYLIQQYLSERHIVFFTMSLVLLFGLGYLLVHATARLMNLAQASEEIINNT